MTLLDRWDSLTHQMDAFREVTRRLQVERLDEFIGRKDECEESSRGQHWQSCSRF